MLQNATSSEFDTFPSTPEDQYRSVKAEVSTEVEDIPVGGVFVSVFSDLRIANGHAISGLSLAASGYLDNPELVAEVEAAQDDLIAFEKAVMAWITESKRAFRDVLAEVGRTAA